MYLPILPNPQPTPKEKHAPLPFHQVTPPSVPPRPCRPQIPHNTRVLHSRGQQNVTLETPARSERVDHSRGHAKTTWRAWGARWARSRDVGAAAAAAGKVTVTGTGTGTVTGVGTRRLGGGKRAVRGSPQRALGAGRTRTTAAGWRGRAGRSMWIPIIGCAPSSLRVLSFFVSSAAASCSSDLASSAEPKTRVCWGADQVIGNRLQIYKRTSIYLYTYLNCNNTRHTTQQHVFNS